jgi:hypothetical protein
MLVKIFPPRGPYLVKISNPCKMSQQARQDDEEAGIDRTEASGDGS